MLLIILNIPLIIANQDTYFYIRQDLRALSGHLVTISVLSKLECAFICKNVEICGIANYEKNNSKCELVQKGKGVSDIATETTEGWEMIGKKNQNKTIDKLK